MSHILTTPSSFSSQKGFIALASLLVIAAVTVSIAISVALLGVGEASTSLSFKKGQEALKMAEGCGEEALLRIRNDVNYSGGNLSLTSGLCTINVSGTGSDRVIDITSEVAGPPRYIKRLQVTVKRTGQSVNIINWEEVE